MIMIKLLIEKATYVQSCFNQSGFYSRNKYRKFCEEDLTGGESWEFVFCFEK